MNNVRWRSHASVAALVMAMCSASGIVQAQ